MKLFLKKLTFVLMSALLFVGLTGISASAEENENGLTKEQKELSLTLIKHLDHFTDSNGNKQIKIINQDELKNEMKHVDIPLTYKQLEEAISQFNYYMGNGDNIVTKTADDIHNQLKHQTSDQIKIAKISCGDALTAIGMIHAGSYTAAAYFLGITGPAAVVIPLLVSTVYGIASIACD